MDPAEICLRNVVHIERGKPATREDAIACEEPLEIRVRGKSVAVTMRTPGADAELAAGFLLSEGIIRHRSDVIEIGPCSEPDAQGNIINVFLSPHVEFDPARLTRHVFASSSCGLCGKASIEAVQQQFSPIASSIKVSAEIIAGLSERMRSAQAAFSQTGGVHAAALFEIEGKLIVVREDVGRHNAVDKVIGHAFLHGMLPLSEHLLLVSGRASFEIVQKALSAAIPMIAAVSAPSSLAVDFARENGQTLIGFLRGASMNIYSNPKCILTGFDNSP